MGLRIEGARYWTYTPQRLQQSTSLVVIFDVWAFARQQAGDKDDHPDDKRCNKNSDCLVKARVKDAISFIDCDADADGDAKLEEELVAEAGEEVLAARLVPLSAVLGVSSAQKPVEQVFDS